MVVILALGTLSDSKWTFNPQQWFVSLSQAPHKRPSHPLWVVPELAGSPRKIHCSLVPPRGSFAELKIRQKVKTRGRARSFFLITFILLLVVVMVVVVGWLVFTERWGISCPCPENWINWPEVCWWWVALSKMKTKTQNHIPVLSLYLRKKASLVIKMTAWLSKCSGSF